MNIHDTIYINQLHTARGRDINPNCRTLDYESYLVKCRLDFRCKQIKLREGDRLVGIRNVRAGEAICKREREMHETGLGR